MLAALCVALGRTLDLAPLFLPLMPAVAALPAIGRPSGRSVLWAGAAALAGVAALGWGARPLNVAVALAGVLSVTALVRAAARRGRRQETKIACLGRLAQVTQAAVLPRPPEWVGGVRLEARYLAATPGATVGGDICGAERTPFGVRLLIGDVSGKGLDVVATAAETLHIWRELAHHEPSLAGIALRMDTSVTRIHHHDGFVTALLINVHDDGRIELLNCGHPPPLLIRAGRAQWLDGLDATAPLGLMRMVADRCPTTVVRPAPGDWLLLCTDGVAECRNQDGEFYPLAERLTSLCGHEPTVVLDALEADLARHRDSRGRDDAMLLLMRPLQQQHTG
ncbi:PP2C family protein-serine/threonine phosphatase [Streptomyces sp. NPDC047117]|uniref:PP2C family protein-serine/threonine phosphatase n=1 Tax=unclassified Streptomyces TaxID=2593676 RepID=UPI0033D794DE